MTRRLIYKLIVGIVTFALGLGLTSVWDANRPISLCELDANPSLYAGKTFRFRAVVEKTGLGMTAASVCGADKENPESGPSMRIELDPNEAAKFALPVSTAPSKYAAGRFYLTDAVIVGQLDSHWGLGCFAPKYHMTNARVEKVFKVQEFDNVPQALEWFRSNSY